jgi:phospholipid-binding lipoprotein MlaA
MLGLAGCAVSPDPDSLDFDPFEDFNRSAHAVNLAVDEVAFGPTARGWGGGVPQPIRTGISNVNSHWSLPRETIQRALQGRPLRVAENAMRFAVNTVFGFGGLLDPAKEMGLPYRETNFDETFFIWGFPEGGYLELPLGGPGTQRDWLGWALDIGLDPMVYVLPGGAVDGLFAVGALDIVNDRYEIDPVLEALLYESADSYTAQRISYLQNMRARLQGETNLELLEDVYADY